MAIKMKAEVSEFKETDYSLIQYAQKLREGSKFRFAQAEADIFESWFNENYPHLYLKVEYNTDTKKTTFSL